MCLEPEVSCLFKCTTEKKKPTTNQPKKNNDTNPCLRVVVLIRLKNMASAAIQTSNETRQLFFYLLMTWSRCKLPSKSLHCKELMTLKPRVSRKFL